MPVALAEAAVIALHRRLDQAHRIVRGALETILTEAEPGVARVKRAGPRRDAAFGRNLGAVNAHVPLNRRTDQQPQLVVVHST
jgi:hypothetical protein